MTTTTRLASPAPRRIGPMLGAAWAGLRHVLAWPARVHRARVLMDQMGRMSDVELRDIGLSRQDLRDAGALRLDVDPSWMLRHRAAQRRRR